MLGSPRDDATIDVAAVGRRVGVALFLAGVASTVVGTIAHLARALPLSELLRRPAVQTGLLLGCAAVTIVRITARRRERHANGATDPARHSKSVARQVSETDVRTPPPSDVGPVSGTHEAPGLEDPESAAGPENWLRRGTVVCAGCLGVHEESSLEHTLGVCPDCRHHLRLPARARLRHLIDPDSFVEWDTGPVSADPLGFVDTVPYGARILHAQRVTGERDAVVTGAAEVCGMPAAVAAFEFGFMGGSMGAVVGEKVFRLFQRARERRIPAIVVVASGGARMQEGTLSLLQMAKVAVAIDAFRRARLPYVSVLTDPTTGGVAGSLAMLGDVIVAEPGALIAFAGPRVIEQTIRAPLPPNFQRAERLLERGLVDAVVPRAQLRPWVGNVLSALWRPERHL